MKFFFDNTKEYDCYLEPITKLSRPKGSSQGNSTVTALVYNFDSIKDYLVERKSFFGEPASADAITKSKDGKRYVFIEFKSKNADVEKLKSKVIDSVLVLSVIEGKKYFDYTGLDFICVYIPKLEGINDKSKTRFNVFRNQPYSSLFRRVKLLTYAEFDSNYTQYIQDIRDIR